MKFNGFEILGGTKRIMISAPHAVEQTREGKIKYAEKETAIIARRLNQLGYPVVIKTENVNDDANYDFDCPYKQELFKFCNDNKVSFVLDLHQLSSTREMDFCLGTGDETNRNLLSYKNIADLTRKLANNDGFSMTINDPFGASSVRTIAGFCASKNIPSMQLEINSKLVASYCNATQLDNVIDFVRKLCNLIDKEVLDENNFDN